MTKLQKTKEEYQEMDQETLDEVFIELCYDGHLEDIKYILTSSDLSLHANIHAGETEGRVEDGLRYACYNNNMTLVKYLLSSPELKEHADIDGEDEYGGNSGLSYAFTNGYIDLAIYLLSSPDLKKHATFKDEMIKEILNDVIEPFYEIFKYLIFERNINKTSNIQLLIDDNPELDQMFQKRELNKKIIKELPDNTFKNKQNRKNKI